MQAYWFGQAMYRSNFVYWGRKTYHRNPRIKATRWWPPAMCWDLMEKEGMI